MRVYLERGRSWVFAAAVDWPGWCRRGKGDAGALETLRRYAPRYAAVVGGDFVLTELEIIGRVSGGATTDFGAPEARGRWDDEPLSKAEAERQASLVEACWRAFDRIAAGAPAVLSKGPRGGGRDTAQIVAHVRDAEHSYGRKLGLRMPPKTPWDQQREALSAIFRTRNAGGAWPVRYALRRVAWHVLDHAWEIEDKS